MRDFVNLFHTHTAFNGIAQKPNSLGSWTGELGPDFRFVGLFIRAPQVVAVAAETEALDFLSGRRIPYANL